MVERRKAALVLDMQRGAETAGAEEVQGEWSAGQGPRRCRVSGGQGRGRASASVQLP